MLAILVALALVLLLGVDVSVSVNKTKYSCHSKLSEKGLDIGCRSTEEK